MTCFTVSYKPSSELPKMIDNAISFSYNSLKLSFAPCIKTLTHWGRVTHICISKLIIIGSNNGLSPGWGQAIIWTSAGLLSIGPLGTNFSYILIKLQNFSVMKMHLKMLSAKCRPFCLGLIVLRPDDIKWCHWTWSTLVLIMAWYLKIQPSGTN